MKNKFIYLITAILALSSCNSFLEEVSQDEIVPKSTKDLSEFLLGEGYVRDTKVIAPYLDIMTDDAKCYFGKPGLIANDTRESGFGYYTWQEQPEYTLSGPVRADNAWQTYYRYIVISNLVIDKLPEVSGTQTEKDKIKAEALCIRANAYFMLVNLYAKPYDPATAQTTLGVPVNSMTYMEDILMQRETLAKNYEIIVTDLKEAVTLFDGITTNKNIFRWNSTAANLLLSRVYLFMKDYKNCQKYATAVMTKNPSLYDLNAKANDATAAAKQFLNISNPEILFSYSDWSIGYFAAGSNGCFPASESLKSAYAVDDLRYGKSTGAFIREQGNIFGKQYTQFKSTSKSTTQVYGYALRTAEAYLNRAEAYAEDGKLIEALNDLNFLRKFRIKKATYVDLASSVKEEVIEMVRKERRLEFCYEQMRWFDLRRWDMPEITHEFIEQYNPTTVSSFYTLKAKDDAYTLPIPLAVMEYQPDLKNNPRPVRTKNTL